jgi:hypothetical protein
MRALMRKSLIAILMLPLLIVCGAQTPPTAAEAFNLRIRCKQMADEKADARLSSRQKDVPDFRKGFPSLDDMEYRLVFNGPIFINQARIASSHRNRVGAAGF